MYLWRKTAEVHWVEAHEDLLQAHARGQLVIVRRPERKRLELKIVCRSRRDSSALLGEFGGRIEALPRNWLQRFARGDSKVIKIGKRLTVVGSINELQRCSVRRPQRNSRHRARSDALRRAHSAPGDIKPALLVIPASLAFGTGEHATTAMSLRFLEQLTRRWNPGWSLADLGTGSGILALAAKCFGAGQAIGIDNGSRGDFGGQIKCPIEQNSRRQFSIRRCPQVEPGTEDRCDYGKFIQRFAYRNPAETQRQRVPDSLGHFAQPARRIGSRIAAETPRHH